MTKFVLGWTAPNGARGFNPAPRDQNDAESLARVKSGYGLTYTAVPFDQAAAWRDAAMIDPDSQANGEFMINSSGDPVPAHLVPGRVKLEDQTVELLIGKVSAMQAAMRAFKDAAFDDIRAFQDALAAQYRAERSGRRGGVCLASYDGLKKIEVSVADTLTFGPELSVAKDLIDQCISDWAKGANDNLKVLVNDAFRVGSTGKIQVDRVIGLRRLEINDDRWRQAMVAISDALRAQSSRTYIRFYQRATPDAKWEQVVLDMSSL